MTSALQHETLTISTLSPVHIGTGDSFVPGQYFIDNGLLHFLGDQGLLHGLGTELRGSLLALLERDQGEALLLALQRWLRQHADALLPYASQLLPVSPAVQQFYDRRFGEVMQQGRQRRDAKINKLEIQCQITTGGARHLYLPGTSLKGAIRTAVIDALKNAVPPGKLPRPNYRDTRSGQQLEQQLAGYHNVADDPFRGLRVADAAWCGEGPGQEILFAVNRPYRPRNSGKPAKGLNQVLECLGPARSRAFTGAWSLQPELPDQHEHPTRARLPADLDSLAKRCNQFYLPLLIDELERLRQCGYASHYPFDPERSWLKAVRELITGPLKAALLGGRVVVLRVGRFKGAEANTLNQLRQIYIRQLNKALATPTTCWLAGLSDTGQDALLPFGWVLLERGDAHHSALADCLDGLHRRRAGELAEAQERQRQLQQAREAEQARRQQEAAKRQAYQEQQAARAAALADMSDVGRAIQAMRDQWDNDRRFDIRQPSGTLRNLLNSAIDLAAGEGSREEKSELRALAIEVLAYLGVDRRNKRVKERLAKLT